MKSFICSKVPISTDLFYYISKNLSTESQLGKGPNRTRNTRETCIYLFLYFKSIFLKLNLTFYFKLIYFDVFILFYIKNNFKKIKKYIILIYF
jgi:hypothetical protein